MNGTEGDAVWGDFHADPMRASLHEGYATQDQPHYLGRPMTAGQAVPVFPGTACR